MFSRRVAGVVMVGAMLIPLVGAGGAAAAKPVPPPVGERALTPQEQAEADARLAAAEAYVASADARSAELVTLACVTPLADGTEGTTEDATTSGCSTPQGFLAVEARDQDKGTYCGPAVGQVIANYAWAMRAGANKYTQAKIAGWMQTDIRGLTNAPELEDGLELSTAGAPRRPAAWNWVVAALFDSDRDGQVGDQLHAMLRSNVSNSKMPLAVPVKPHDNSDRFHLSSWSKPVNSPGHWIAAYGWVGLWTGTDAARLYYTDSSRDEGGSTGKFWDPVRHIAQMIMDHTQRLVW